MENRAEGKISVTCLHFVLFIIYLCIIESFVGSSVWTYGATRGQYCTTHVYPGLWVGGRQASLRVSGGVPASPLAWMGVFICACGDTCLCCVSVNVRKDHIEKNLAGRPPSGLTDFHTDTFAAVQLSPLCFAWISRRCSHLLSSLIMLIISVSVFSLGLHTQWPWV